MRKLKILCTAAEEEELRTAKNIHGLDITYLLTGIGSTSTTYRITKMLTEQKFDLAINIGIAGSFSEKLPLGSVSRIEKESFGDLGFETFSGFQTLFDYKILDADTYPYKGGSLHAPNLSQNIELALANYERVSAITVQTVSGIPEKTERLKNNFNPLIESMEGAAFFFVCLLEKIPFIELRAVSNYVGERDRSKWDIPLALRNLQEANRKLFAALEREEVAE